MSVLTFLFTDIEGSTRRWEADAEAMRIALETATACCEATASRDRPGVQLHRRRDVRGVLLSRSASTPQLAAQRALELPVRMGIATGEAELRGDDYFGTVLNRTARVMAAGHGGQILLDGATAGLHQRDRSIRWDRGDYGISPNRSTYSKSQADGLRTEFPPLKTVGPTTGNLRPRDHHIIGREAERRRSAVRAEGTSLGDVDRRRWRG